MKVLLLLLASLILVGCEGAPPSAAPTIDSERTREEPEVQTTGVLYEQLHSGLFQADAAVRKIGDALDIAREIQAKVPPDLAEAMRDMVATLDDAGALLSDATGGDPPTEAQVKADETAFISKRSRLIVLVGNTLKQMREQMGVAADLADSGPASIQKSCAKVDALLNQVIDDLLGSLEALGAKEDSQ
jgi:hypothetical protein